MNESGANKYNEFLRELLSTFLYAKVSTLNVALRGAPEKALHIILQVMIILIQPRKDPSYDGLCKLKLQDCRAVSLSVLLGFNKYHESDTEVPKTKTPTIVDRSTSEYQATLHIESDSIKRTSITPDAGQTSIEAVKMRFDIARIIRKKMHQPKGRT